VAEKGSMNRNLAMKWNIFAVNWRREEKEVPRMVDI
jgi:hypothetical protein